MEQVTSIDAVQGAVVVGQVSVERYDTIVGKARVLVEQVSAAQFALGDLALDIEPIRDLDGGDRAPLGEVDAVLRRFAEDIGMSFHTVKGYRWVSSRWPEHRRVEGVSHSVHRILASIRSEEARFETIKYPPLHERSGERRWTVDGAKRAVGDKVDTPFTTAEKVEAVQDLVADEQVAARVATDLLTRSSVAFKAMADPSARQSVNRAQVDHALQAVEQQQRDLEEATGIDLSGRGGSPLLPGRVRCMEFVDLVGACALFVSQVGSVMPTLAGHDFTDDERESVTMSLARVRATADWIEHAATTGNLSLDEGLAALLGDQ